MHHLSPNRLFATLLMTVALASRAGAQVNVTVDASMVVRTVDDRIFGLNTAVWDGSFSDAQTLSDLMLINTRALRFPGGSTSDGYHWMTNMNDGNTYTWPTSFDVFAGTATAIGANAFITVNYGSGTPQEAAAWVTYSSVTKAYGFKYWEIGNECYGTWEEDNQALAHDPFTYATRAAAYFAAMKAADPTIKIGVVAVTGEDTFSNGYASHPATNAREGTTHNGWTPVMLATLKSLGVTPDFLIYHRYEQNPNAESDPGLLQAALTWPSDAADLRQQLTDYLGASGAAVELVVTENNSVNTNPGKQSTSLVNALYLADSVSNVMQTEFNSLVWWDLYNGQLTTDNNSASLYGWRQYGDYGVESPAHDRYPTFYAMELMAHFARGGDSVVKASSDNPLLSAYAAKRADGTLSILVINKSPTSTFPVNFAVTGFSPQSTATVYAYGIAQDTAAETGSGSPDVALSTLSNAAATFSASFAPYSLSVVSLSTPSNAPAATSQPVSQTVATGSTVVFSFPTTGSPNATYQWSLNGTPISSAAGATLIVTGATAADAGTYSAVATNASGSVTSSSASLTVVSTGNPGRLTNLSCRAQVGTGANLIFVGFVVGGAGTSGTQSVLARASGPALALAPFNVGGTLPDPTLTLNNLTTGGVLASNSGWAGSAAISAAASAVGAFSWSNPSSHDSALVEALPEDNYTAGIAGASGDTGVALAEVYDATAPGAYTPATPRLVNLSARVQVGTGSNVVFAGFVIGGTTAKTVLIRASGPALSLSPFNVMGTLPDPALTLNDLANSSVIATNTVWGGDPAVTTAAASVGAFPWAAGSRDSAILTTLPPGNYTAEVSGAGGDSGVALVEVYEVP
jgi:alpha-L-arabinofuranosidase